MTVTHRIRLRRGRCDIVIKMAASTEQQHETEETQKTANVMEDAEPSSLQEEILNEQKNVTFASLVCQT